MINLIFATWLSVYPPTGLIELCLEGRGVNKFECEHSIQLVKECLKKEDPKCLIDYKRILKLLKDVNSSHNNKHKYISDTGWGHWDVSLSGDCEDLALVKEQTLITNGYPEEFLGIATGYSKRGNHHAVLIVRFGENLYVLDKDPVHTARMSDLKWSYFPSYVMLNWENN